MRQQSKWIWIFFGLAALFIIIGLIGSMGSEGAGGSNAEGGAGAGDVIYQLAYPAAVILIAAGLFYLVIRRSRK